jgi:hypothetical protein
MSDWLNDSSGMTEYSGWHIETAWEHRLLTLLMLMEYKTFDLKAQLKGDYIGATAGADDNGNYRGIKTPFLAGYSGAVSVILQGFDLGYITPPTDNNMFYDLPSLGVSYLTPLDTYARNIDTFARGWVDQIGCDIAFAFIPAAEGIGTGAQAGYINIAGTHTRNMPNMSYSNGPVTLQTARVNSGGVAAVLRLCKDVS